MKKRLTQRMRRLPRAYLAVAVPLAIPLLLAAVRIAPEDRGVAEASMIPPPELRYDALLQPSPATLPEHSVVLTIEKGDTLNDVLLAGGLTRGESAMLTKQLSGTIDLRRLRPGHMVRFHHDANGAVDAVQMKVVGWGDVEAVRTPEGFSVESRQAEIREVESVISATVETSLWDALRAAGEGPQLVQSLADVFQWDIDFFELRRGDSFTVVVRKKYAGADVVGYGPIAAARFTHRGTTYEAFRHEAPDGFGGYYARTGTPLRKQFLRAPLQFSRITSGFSKRRFHPVLNYFRPHHGVDYGAPVGTPVMTTADGVVVEASNKRGEGNFVRIRHTSRLETYYLHLSRFAKGVKKGTKVVQGDVIGYVGQTGLATGPHLDYRVKDAGTWLDPLKLKSITPDPLRGGSLQTFRANVARLVPRLAQPATAVAETKPRRRALF